MQTTLLGLAMALILALIAALVGPYFIDWSQFRGQFEAEATRLIGAPVRVAGALDARLLPTPTLRLRSVAVGGANDPGRVRADKLDVEFSLGALMRGEWRADQLTINGFALDLGLDAQGKLDWPASGLSNLAGLTVDRFNLTGRIALHDAASRSTVELNDIAFSGELRALAGSLRGDGNFLMGGARYPFRLVSGRGTNGNSTRLHLTIDPGARALSADLDGLVTFEARSPRFDGTVMLAAPAPARADPDPSRTPWRVSARVKADPAAARFEQLETLYGPDDRALKLSGDGELRFGASPRLHAALSARQLDADRLLAKDGAAADPAPWPSQLRGLARSLPQPALATQIEISAEQIMLGGRPVQNVVADLRSDTRSWMLERLELRAPGGSQLALSGGAAPGAADGFKGTLSIDSADPDLLAAWLQGRGDSAGRVPKPLRARAAISMAADSVLIDALKAELDGGTLQGRIALSSPAPGRGSRVEAALKADRLDLDGSIGLLRSLAGPLAEWPDEAVLSLDVARATARGQVLQPVVARLHYGPGAIALEQLKIGAADGLMLQGEGSFDRGNSTGHLQLNATAASLGQFAGAIGSIAPMAAARLAAMGETPGATRATLAFDLDAKQAAPGRVNARATVELDSPQLKGTASLSAKPAIADLRATDLDALSRGELTLETRLTAERGQALLALLGLERAIAASEGAARLEASATGAWRAPLRLKLHLTGTELDAEAEGSAEPWAVEPKATLNLNAHRLSVAPLLQLEGSDASAAAISLTSRLEVAGDKLTFNTINGSAAGSQLRGRVAVTLGDEIAVEGEAGVDTLALAPAFRLALGAAGSNQAAPLGRGLLRGWRGRLAFQALRGVLPGGSELQPIGGVIRSDGRSLTVESGGKLGGGEAKVDIHAQPSEAGVALNLRLQLAGADAAALRYRALAMPAGRVAMRMTLDSSGRSAAALAGALSGGGTVSLDAARIAGLDPAAFEVAIRAGDAGQPVDATSLERLLAPLLSAGALPVAAVQIPFSLKDGQLRVPPTTLDSPTARAVVSGGYDIPADQVDIRATLTSTTVTTISVRPEIQLFVIGPPDALVRSVDVSGLSSWLAVRRIDRETQKLELLEREAAPPAPLPASMPPNNATPPKSSPPIIGPQPAETSVPPMIKPPPRAPDQPVANVPVPERDPRDAVPKTRLQPPSATVPPQASRPTAAREQAAPLPPPIEIRPAPGDVRQPRRRPLTIAPQTSQ
ncbi:MAG: AsmA family protein [Rhodopseudomonas sp.]|uniref:AsmA family protein n=1 Tax=Rhodopseudomonas sp. TaxID=1078 RepID=UPI0018401553|nr:AsmA family protein [Rhodopseudomonas sp.]NVN87460.1 AsmA family protein [Rhodopseudomonas sp.]